MKKKLINITPARFRCGETSPCCPAIFQSDANTYLIVGRAVSLSEHPNLKGRIGGDETLIEISADLVREALKAKKRK